MAILNFDYKVKSIIRPYVEKYFRYGVYATVTTTDNQSWTEKMYEAKSLVTSEEYSYDTAMDIEEDTLLNLSAPTIATLPEGATVSHFTIVTPDPSVMISNNEDGQDHGLVWWESGKTENFEVSSEWLQGPQIQTSTTFNPETAKPLVSDYAEELIKRTATSPLPIDFIVESINLISNTPNVFVDYSWETGFICYGIDAPTEKLVTGDVLNSSVEVIRGLDIAVDFTIQTDNPEGVTGGVRIYAMNEKIVHIFDEQIGRFWVRGLAAGETEIRVDYMGMNIGTVQVKVIEPKIAIDVKFDSTNSYAGQPIEATVTASYENGDRFEAERYEVGTSDATVQEVSKGVYQITPTSSGVSEIQVKAYHISGNVAEKTVRIPVRNKELYRFHTIPEEMSVVAGQVFTAGAHFVNDKEGMEHDDNDIIWAILEGEDLIQGELNPGRFLKLKAIGSGKVVAKASVYDHESISTFNIVGEDKMFVHTTRNHIEVVVGETEDLWYDAINGSIDDINIGVTKLGRIEVTYPESGRIQIAGIAEGEAKISFYDKDFLYKDVTITVVKERSSLFAMSEPGEIYMPGEDSPEQWSDDRHEPNYVESKGMSTILYGRMSGKEDPSHAIKSGIGDHDDLFVKKPAFENSVQAFKYAARLRGKKKHSTMIYPEIRFQYSVQYKGDLYVTYNESPYEVNIDAYPGKKFEFKITEERKLESERAYEVEMAIKGNVSQKSLEYAVAWKANVQVKDEGDVKDLFVSGGGKGDFIGSGAGTSWRMGNGFVYDTYNVSRFSGVVPKKYYSYTSYEAEFDYKPIPGDSTGIPDDDLIGLIFKAKDTKNFYMMLIESQDRVKESNRTGDNLDGFDIYNDSPDQWNARSVSSGPYIRNETQWRLFVETMGWKKQHRRIYKVTNGVMKRVNATDLGGGNGWNFNVMQSMKVRSMGKKVELYVRHSLTGDYSKVFEVDTDWAEGSFGVMNISQAVQFHGIRVKEFQEIEGRIPETGYDTYAGIGSKTISSSGKEYVKAQVISKLATPSQVYEITEVKGEVTDSSAGLVSVSVTAPLVVKSNNPPNAGEAIETKIIKSGKIKITPDQIDLNTAAAVYRDAKEFFKAEIAKFKSDHPEMSAASVVPTFTLINPGAGETEFDFTQDRLLMWKAVPEIVTTEKEYEHIAFAYEGWTTAKALTDFVGGKWSKYTLVFSDNSGTVNPKYDAWKWEKAGAVNEHGDSTDRLLIKTTEFYLGTFPADIHNTGVVNSDGITYVDIPPNHEHYIEPYEKTPMPGIYDDVHYLLYKQPVGKQTFVWMYWESQKNITTRSSGLPENKLTGKYIIKTDRQNDRVAIVCDEDPRYIPWISGKYIGQGKVNGKRPFFGDNSGKANMVGVPTDTVFLPDNLVNMQGPFVESEDSRVNVSIDTGKKTASFSSDFKDAYVWYTDWYTGFVQDPNGHYATLDQVTEIDDVVKINPEIEQGYDENVSISHVEVISDNPFVSTWVEKTSGESSGLLGTYYRYPQETENVREAFVVGGDYRIKEQVFRMEEAVVGTQKSGYPATESFLCGSEPIRGNIQPRTEEEIISLYVPAGQAKLMIAASFMVDTGNKYPDMHIEAPTGEKFGLKFNNGTWLATEVSKTDQICCSKYTFYGEEATRERMTFESPKEGLWKVYVYNQGNQNADYAITTNMGSTARTTFTTKYSADPWSLVVKVNDVTMSSVTQNGKEIIVSAPLVSSDLVHIAYTAGGYKVSDMPTQSDFQMTEVPPYQIVSVTKNGVEIPQSTTEGYDIVGQEFRIRGSYVTPGLIRVRYALGVVDNVFNLAKEVGQAAEVYLSGAKLDKTKYTIGGGKLIIQRDILRPKDWVHIQSYRVVSKFDPRKENYLGDFEMSRIDPFINFDWGTQSPFTGVAATSGALSFMPLAMIADEIAFKCTVEAEINYPSSEVIDTSNFTGTWSKFDENIGADVGDWHGPPESGYTKVTNLANQSYRSGWYNPTHVDMKDYNFAFSVQEVNSGDDDMYGAMFRFDPATKNFYSFEWDAGGMDVNGMAVYRNICLNPSQYGSATLSYTKTRLVHDPEKWAMGASQINNIEVRVIGQSITVFVNGVQKLNVIDNAPDALSQGAWGPITKSQPNTYFWNFSASKILTHKLTASINTTAAKPVSDTERTKELTVDPRTMQNLFAVDIVNFLVSKSLTVNDATVRYLIKNDLSDFPCYFTGKDIVTFNESALVLSTVLSRPISTPEKPAWLDYREINRGYISPDSATDVYSPDQPEPYIDPIAVPSTYSGNDGFAINWSGNIFAPVSGVYTFYATSDDGFKLWVNRNLVIDSWTEEGKRTASGSVTLKAGTWYDFSANYFEGEGNASVKLEWSHPAQARSVITSESFSARIGYKVRAQVKQATPLPWNPMIHAGYYYLQENEHYMYADKQRLIKTPVDHQILIQPRPQQAAPLIVRDNEGNILRKVSFYEEVFDTTGDLIEIRPTLVNREVMSGSGHNRYYFAYKDVDPDTLVVKLNGVTLSANEYSLSADRYAVEMMEAPQITDQLEFEYCLMYSYMVDYNHDVVNDVAKITLHSAYDPERMKDMEIIYESGKDSPFKIADEVSLNPILSHNHKGFLYITNKVNEQPKAVEMHLSPKTISSDGQGKTLVTVKVTDKYNNPVQNKMAYVFRDGTPISSSQTNKAGEVYVYDQPVPRADMISRYEVTCEGLRNEVLLNYYVPDLDKRYALELKTSKSSLSAGQSDKATIYVTLRNESWEPAAGEIVKLTIRNTYGDVTETQVTTDAFGQKEITIDSLDDQQGNYTIRASYSMGAESASTILFIRVIGA